MIRRPKSCESDDDLIKQDREFRQSKEQANSVKLVLAGKRKTQPVENKDEDKPRSQFAKERLQKKKKDAMVDHTVLQEIDGIAPRRCVVNSVVSRNVPSVIQSNEMWKPSQSHLMFPQPPILDLTRCQENKNGVKKSIFMQQQEEITGLGRNHDPTSSTDNLPAKSVGLDDKLLELGNRSCVINCDLMDSDEIHRENISLLSNMSHEERLKERNEILSGLTDEQVAFVRSFRTKRESNREERMETNIIELNSKGENVSKIESQSVEVAVDIEMTDQDVAPSEEEDLFNPPLAVAEAANWVNMDKLELDKLKWMSQVPKSKILKNGEEFVARFDFDGDLLPYDSHKSWREGLHHHGEEAERAGYTLDELFIFVRSRVTQQRHLGLKTLANIIRNAKEGLYDRSLDCNIVQLMVDAGLVLLLRFAIDEKTALVYQEALRALYYLICSEADDKCLDAVETWFPCDLYPGISSLTHSQEKVRQELDSEEKELKDVEMIKLDIIRALVRMDVLLRLRYFLETISLSPPDVIHILGILKRISRHSLTAASSVASTPRLLEVICRQFLPTNYVSLYAELRVTKVTSVYGIPLKHVMQLLKVLASRGRHIASNIVNNYDIMNRIQTYVSMEPTEGQLPIGEALELSKESYSLWSIFMSYGLKKAQEAYVNFFPVIIKKLLFYRDKIDININVESNRFNYDIGSHLVHLMTKALNVAAYGSLLYNRMKRKEASITTARGEEQVLQPPQIAWEEFDQIFELVLICISKWVVQMTESCFEAKKLLGSFFHFTTVYLTKWRDQTSFEGAKFIAKIKLIYSSIESLLRCSVLDVLFHNLIHRSNLLSDLNPGTSRDPENLGSLACVCHGGEVVPVVQSNSPFPLLIHLASLLQTLVSHHPSSTEVTVDSFLNHPKLLAYITRLGSSARGLQGHWMNRIEVYCLVDILKMASVRGCDHPVVFHKCALSLLPCVHVGDESLVQTLFENVICNSLFLPDVGQIESDLGHLSVLDRAKPLAFAGFNQPTIAPSKLIASALENIDSIGKDFVKQLLPSKSLEESNVRVNNVTFLVNSTTMDLSPDSLIFDPYWTLAPLKLIQLHRQSTKAQETSQVSSSDRLASVVRWLQMTFILLHSRSALNSRQCDPTGWFRHLSLVFCVDKDLFLDPRVNGYTQACLLIVYGNARSRSFNWLNTYPDLPRCFDWFKELIEDFAAYSHGDSTFALFVVTPLQRHWPVAYRELLFGEQSMVTLPFIRLTTEDVDQFIPKDQFFDPVEDNKNLLVKYKSALGSGLLDKNRNSFLYHFAASHGK